MLLGNGDGTFQAEKIYPATGPITGIAQAPVRQDGIESLLGIDSASRHFVLLPGVGDVTFGTPVFYPTDQVPVAILTADFDADRAPDIVLLNALQSEGALVPVGGGLSVYYNQGGDHVALTSTSTRPNASQLVTLTARVTPSPFEPGTPTGKVTFKDGARYLGNVPMTAGAASLSTTFADGTHTILALYSDDGNFNPNHSGIVTIMAQP